MSLVRVMLVLFIGLVAVSVSCNKSSSNSAGSRSKVVQYPAFTQMETAMYGPPPTYYAFSGNYPSDWPSSIQLPADIMVHDPGGKIVSNNEAASGLPYKSWYVAGITQTYSNKEQLAGWFKDQLKDDYQFRGSTNDNQIKFFATPSYNSDIKEIVMSFTDYYEFDNWIPFRINVIFN